MLLYQSAERQLLDIENRETGFSGFGNDDFLRRQAGLPVVPQDVYQR